MVGPGFARIDLAQTLTHRKRRRRLRLLLVCAVALALVCGPLVLAGHLQPPVGAAASHRPAVSAGSATARSVHIGEPLGAVIHVCVATEQWPPFGLLGLINSTLAHAVNRSALVFHVVAPPRMHALLALLESLFPDLDLRVFGMAAQGAGDKIRHRLEALRPEAGGGGDEPEPPPPPIYEWAVAYLPTLFPRLRRLIWLDADAVVRTDLGALWHTPLQGLPLGAVADCSQRIERGVNASLFTMLRTPGLAPRGCAFAPGVLLVDLMQWAALDATARVEYWVAQYLRTPGGGGGGGRLFALAPRSPSPQTPMLLALRGGWLPLEPRWNVHGLGQPGAGDAERRAVAAWPRVWQAASATEAVGARLLATADRRGHILHFSGLQKPWLPSARSAEMCAAAPAAYGGAPGRGRAPAPELRPCAEAWTDVAQRSSHVLGWDQRRGSAWEAAAVADRPGGAAAGEPTAVAKELTARPPAVKDRPSKPASKGEGKPKATPKDPPKKTPKAKSSSKAKAKESQPSGKRPSGAAPSKKKK